MFIGGKTKLVLRKKPYPVPSLLKKQNVIGPIDYDSITIKKNNDYDKLDLFGIQEQKLSEE